ncbi:MAG: LegC family aminotransferase, partial [Sphingobacteriales bacterium]
MEKFNSTLSLIRSFYPGSDFIPLSEPRFRGNEKKYLAQTIDSTYVSSVGKYVDDFEKLLAQVSMTAKAVAVVNGTSALQVGLKLLGVKSGDEVITQALTFVATANAILYNGAHPLFIDVDIDTMGLSPVAVGEFLELYGELREDGCYNKKTGRKISACMPMHTFGFPIHIDQLIKICEKWNIPILEDAAEALGSEYHGKSVGSFGKLGAFSFNGNKIVTSGGGGALVTNDIEYAEKGKYLTTTAKSPHAYEFYHTEMGYNFRMPNINAALACAQLEQLTSFVDDKRLLAKAYETHFKT